MSSVWRFFTKLSASEAMCNTCDTRLKTPSGTTTPLNNHLKKHPSLHEEIEREKAAKECQTSQHRKASQNVTMGQQPKVTDCFSPKLKPSHIRSKGMTRKIALFISRGLHSFSVVEEKGFRDMVEYAMPGYQIPSRTTFSRRIIPEMYASMREEVKHKLKQAFEGDVRAFALTSDGWTSKAGDGYISVTCHVVDGDFILHVHAIACRLLPDAHTAGNLRDLLESVIEEFELPQDKQTFIVTDNARNYVSAVQHAGWTSLRCFGHTLQLCVNDAKTELSEFSELCAKARLIVGHYKKSAQARNRLHEIQKAMGAERCLEVIQDVPTRWSSEFQMLQRLVRLKVAVSTELCESDKIENLTSSEWRCAASVTSVLEPFAEATTELSGDTYPTLSEVIPLVHCMETVLQKHITKREECANIASCLLKKFKARFADLKMNTAPALATLLDPRYKDVFFTSGAEKKWAHTLLEETLHNVKSDHVPGDKHMEPQAHESSVWKVLSEMSTVVAEENETISQQVSRYLLKPRIQRSSDPLLWWKTTGRSEFPAIAILARTYLSIPATQTTSERLFSTAGNVVTSRRVSLNPEHAEMLILLHENIK